jgi:hypothetical protein
MQAGWDPREGVYSAVSAASAVLKRQGGRLFGQPDSIFTHVFCVLLVSLVGSPTNRTIQTFL